MDRFHAAAAILAQGVAARACPAAVAEVGTSAGVTWRHATGRLTYDTDAPAVHDDTVFDLASLTKVVATTSLAMRLEERGRISLADHVSSRSRFWTGQDREGVTVRDLLEHCAGLTAWLPFYRDLSGRQDVEAAIAQGALEYAPWTQSVYSDLGFMLVGFLLEDAGGAGLDEQFAELAAGEDLRYRPPHAWRPRMAPTEVDTWRGRLLTGEVHDENAWSLGGVAGHAGLFGTAPALGAFARLVLATFARPTPLGSPHLLARFVTRSTVPRSSRAVGWDTMLTTSSCGTRLSPGAIGHTGFTGTSLWIDPARNLYVALLTNRVHPARDNDRLKTLRPRFHDAVVEAMA